MSHSLSPSNRTLFRWTTATLLALVVLFWPNPGGPQWLHPTHGVRAATFVPNDFVVADFNIFDNTGAVRRYNTSSMPDPATGQPPAIYLPVSALDIAWGPDGNLYFINAPSAVNFGAGGSGVQSFDASTNTLATFVTASALPLAKGMAFGPDGNLYVGLLANPGASAGIGRYCGPLNATCVPGTPLPSGLGSPGSAFYAPPLAGGGLPPYDLAFGPDGNLYASQQVPGSILRFCGPLNSKCAPGSALGLSGTAGDPVFVSLPGIQAFAFAFGPDGNIYVGGVIGLFNAEVFRFCGGPGNGSRCAEGTPAPAAGQTGAAFVSTNLPLGLDFDPMGNLYVSSGSVILRFLGPTCAPAPCEGGPDGLLMGSPVLVPFNTGGLLHPTYLKFPHAILPPPPVLLVGDFDANKVLRYDIPTGIPDPAPGQSGADFVPAGSQGLSSPTGLAFDTGGNLYVGSLDRSSILRFDGGTGAPLPAQGQAGANFVPPGSGGLTSGVVISPVDGNLYVGDFFRRKVLRFCGPMNTMCAPGAPLPAPGQSGADFVPSGAGGLRSPLGLAFGPDENLYVANESDNVLRFDGQTGQFMDVFASNLSGLSSVGFGPVPTEIGFGPDANLYAVETLLTGTAGNFIVSSKVARFDGRTGNPLPASGQSGADFVPNVGELARGGLTFGSDGKLYVTAISSSGGEVLRFDGMTGAFVGTFVSTGLQGPFFLLSRATTLAGAVSGMVFHDSIAPQNILANVQVVAAQPFGNLLVCPFAGLFFQACPKTSTDLNGSYLFSALVPGEYVLTAFPPGSFFPNSILVTAPAQPGQDIVLVPPVPIPSGTTVTPALGLASVPGGNVPVVGWLSTFLLSTQGCPGGSAHFTLSSTTKAAVASGNMTEGPPGTYSVSLGPLNPVKGLLNVLIAFQCPTGITTPTVSLQIYVDPSGTVVDDVTGKGIAGATVTLFRSDTAKGTFTQVPAGSAFMSLSNRNNPDQTNAAGQYGWDVASGFYRLQASAPGFTCDPNNPPHGFTCVNGAVQSGVFAIPPAVTDLTLPLHRINLPPVADAGANQTAECTGPSGVTVTLDGSKSSDPDGDTLTFSWTEDGNPVGGNTSMLTMTVPLGTHTFALTVTDPGGLSNTATAQVRVQDTTPPTLTLSTTNITVTLPTASASGATVSLAGIASATDTCDPNPTITNNAPANSFFPIGTTTVTFTATDHSGNSSQKTLTVRVVYNFVGYFTPLLNDGSALYQSGRTVPAKFQLTAADGTFVTNAVANIQVFLVLNTPTGTVDESVNTTASGSSNTGTLFRFDHTSNQYIYNLDTGGFATGTYLLRTTLNDGTTHDVNFSIK